MNNETGVICGADEVGEICVSSPYGMNEYLESTDENKKCFMDDGFVRTGDLGKYNNEGRLIFVDRLKSLIKLVPRSS